MENLVMFMVLPFRVGTPVTILEIYIKMKTPERWRTFPRYALFASFLAQKSSKDVKTSWRRTMTSPDIMTSYRDIMWRHVTSTSGVMTNWLCVIHPAETSEITSFQPGDLDLWPMNLTYELIWYIIKVNASTKFRICMSNGSGVRALTDM